MMAAFRRKIKAALEGVSGYRLKRLGSSVFFIDREAPKGQLWFSYETELRWILKDLRINLVLDVGANTGQFVKTLRSDVRYDGRIISFEPVSAVFKELSAEFSDDPYWVGLNYALGSADRKGTINVAGDTRFSSILKANEFCQGRFGARSVGVSEEAMEIRRLDGVLRELSVSGDEIRCFLKMDTQGYDLEVFKGLGDKLDLIWAIQSEISVIPIYEGMPHWTDTIALFEARGFGVAGFFPVNRSGLKTIEFDCLMIR